MRRFVALDCSFRHIVYNSLLKNFYKPDYLSPFRRNCRPRFKLCFLIMGIYGLRNYMSFIQCRMGKHTLMNGLLRSQ